MTRALGLCAAIILLAGCRTSINSPVDARAPRIVQVVIVDGVTAVDPIVEAERGYRVGWYYDFSPFDSIRIDFVATRLTPTSSHDHIVIKVGPAFYLRDSISIPEQGFSMLVMRRDLSKPAFSALVFFVSDPGAAIMISKLRVVGWTTT